VNFSESSFWVIAVSKVIEVGLIVRVMLRPHREPASRIAWVAIITMLPVVGVVAYILFGEVNIGWRRAARLRNVIERMPDMAECTIGENAARAIGIPRQYKHLFDLGHSISGFHPIGGNSARLLADSNATIDEMVNDIDVARDHVHVLFYIWLPDNNGCKIVEALKHAVKRGVKCRAMVDDLGSRLMIRSPHWQAMRDAGVHVAVALPIGKLLRRMLRGRVDLRNHRKIVVIDGRITYCGSQNCADPEFRVKAKFAPWVDAVIRFEGPIARQNQYVFASDWMTYADEDINDLLDRPISASQSGFAAQVVATGPTYRHSAMPQMFEALIYAARRELIISTPYYVPDEPMQNALCAAAYRGVDTTIIFPARNDSWIVGGASRSYYAELLDAGVTIYEYVGGVPHTKSLTLDGEVTLIGSANMDRRSFDLNYENNILFSDAALTGGVRERQQQYISKSNRVTAEDVAAWSVPRRLWNNTLATLGPIL
jgi:cardiolipin synthase